MNTRKDCTPKVFENMAAYQTEMTELNYLTVEMNNLEHYLN
ncbi:MAG: hypothetical protein ACOYPR_02855 [Saprospiraceae bacterium]